MKHSLVLSILLILTIFITGCATFLGQEQNKSRERLNVADWPTPVPETAVATPTPFPKTTLAPTGTPVAQAAVEAEATPESLVTSLDFTGNPLELVKQIRAITGGLTPFGAASITVDGLSIRQGPGETFEDVGTLNKGELAAALGKNEAGDWLYVMTASLVQGWIPVDAVRLTGSLTSASVLPDNQLDSATTQTAATSPSAINISGDVGQADLSFLSQLEPVAAAFVNADGATVHQRPSASSGVVGTLDQGELAGVFGKDPSNEWVFIVTLSLVQGWIPVDSLRTVGALAEAPVLPPDPVGAALARAGVSSPASTGSAPVSVPTIDIDSLAPVATARVNNAALNLRQRPGVSYKLLDTLSLGDEVTILALNRDKEWALLETSSQQRGWGSMDFLDVDGSLANAPQVQTLTPGEDYPADEVAPIVALLASSGAVAATSNNSSGSSTTPVTPASLATTGGNVSLPSNTLAPVTTGEIIEKVDLRRGPGNSYATLQAVTVDELVSVRGANEARDWVVVEATNSRVGWIPVSSLKVESSLDNAPQILTAWVQSNALEVKRGPGIYFETTGTLAINDLVSILALSEGRNWALVETLSGNQGWLPVQFLTINGSLANTPHVAAPPLADASTNESPIPKPGAVPTGKLVIQTSSGGDIMLINADGTGLRRLTDGIDPVLSADGQQVAFTRWQGDTGTLWVINVDGTGERPILGEMRKAKGPDWSPDGSHIVLNYQHGGRIEDKRDCNTFEPGSFPSIPRNAKNVEVNRGSKGNLVLCFTVPPDAQWSLRVVDVADGSFEDLYGGLYAFRPAWDPNQTWRIVSDSGSGLLAVDVNREEFRQSLTDGINDGSPVFSPDGRFLALSTDVQGGHDIFRTNADGSGRVRLTQTPLWVPVQPDSNGHQWNNVAPVWSSDGSQIAFVTDRTGWWEIWVMNADGSNQHPLFSEDINNQLNIRYDFVDERVLSWR